MKIKPAILREALVRTTPALLFDFEAIEANFKQLRNLTLEHGATWAYAIKSFPRQEIFEIAAKYVDAFDISNIAEWNILKAHVTPAHTIWLTNANYAELEFFKKNVPNLIVTVNDMHDFEKIKSFQLPYVIRLASSELLPQNASSRFGLTLSQLHKIEPELLNDKSFKGFHFHQGIEENNFKILQKMLSSVQAKFQNFAGKGLIFNIGGGWQLFSEGEMKMALDQLRHQYKVHVEPGRAMVKGAGFALAPIEKYVVDGDTLRVFTRLSYLAHLQWSKPVFAGILNQSEALETLSVKNLVLEGPTCYEYDKSEVVKVDMPLSMTKGSLVVLENVTSYSTEWNNSFNGISECEVKFVGRRRPDSP